jgi:hypothetical protein
MIHPLYLDDIFIFWRNMKNILERHLISFKRSLYLNAKEVDLYSQHMDCEVTTSCNYHSAGVAALQS